MNSAAIENVRNIEAANRSLAEIPQTIRPAMEIIQGTESNLQDFRNNLQTFEDFQPVAVNAATQELPNFRELISQLEKAQIQKYDDGTYGAGAGDNAALANFIHALKSIGADFAQINEVLEQTASRFERTQQNSQQAERVVTVAPNINISVEGNVIADQSFEASLTDKITKNVCNGMIQAVQSATKGIRSFAN